jgi:hypothetical protein
VALPVAVAGFVYLGMPNIVLGSAMYLVGLYGTGKIAENMYRNVAVRHEFLHAYQMKLLEQARREGRIGNVDDAMVGDIDSFEKIGAFNHAALTTPGDVRTMFDAVAADVEKVIVANSPVRKMLLGSVSGVMRPAELNMALVAVLKICYTVEDLYRELGAPDPQSMAAGTPSREEIIDLYERQSAYVDSLTRPDENGVIRMSAADARAEQVILSTIENILQSPDAAQAFRSLEGKETVPPEVFGELSRALSSREAVKNANDSLVKWAEGQAQKAKTGEPTAITLTENDIQALREAVEKKHPWYEGMWMDIRNLIPIEMTMKKNLDPLGIDDFNFKNLQRTEDNRIISPLGAMRIAGSA